MWYNTLHFPDGYAIIKAVSYANVGKYIFLRSSIMKKLLCCILILSTLCVALASCGGAGGDTNMHNVMKAIAKDNTSTSDDSYKYQTADKRPETPTESYKYVSAVSDGTGYYKHYIHFAASSTVWRTL